jgi:hypothetical protein
VAKRDIAGWVAFVGLLLPRKAWEWSWELVRSHLGEAFVNQLEKVPWLSGGVLEWGLRLGLVAVVVWLFWPHIKERLPWPRTIPLDDAARLAYEAAERAGTLDTLMSVASDPGVTHFKYVFLTLDEVVLYGTRPPSTQVLPIPKEEVDRLFPTNIQPNSLSYLIDNIAIYTNVAVRKEDLKRAIKLHSEGAKVSTKSA